VVMSVLDRMRVGKRMVGYGREDAGEFECAIGTGTFPVVAFHNTRDAHGCGPPALVASRQRV